MTKILFVCLGNICRSPLAEGIAQRLITQRGLDLYVESAGTSSWHKGEAPCHNSVKVAKNHGIDISAQRSRPIVRKDISMFDYVIAMDRNNQADLEAFGFETVYKLGDFGGFKGADVPDPYHFNGFEGFDKVYMMIDACVKELMEMIDKKTL